MRFLGLLVLVAVVFLVLRIAKGGGGGSVGTRRCPHCRQQIPAIGAYCPICGRSVV